MEKFDGIICENVLLRVDERINLKNFGNNMETCGKLWNIKIDSKRIVRIQRNSDFLLKKIM